MSTGWIETYTGKKFYPLEPRPGDVDVLDIAHALSMTCRFNGHTREFYSIAQHCCIVHDLCPQHLKLAGLMHDAAEAYLGDVVSPIKGECYFTDSKSVDGEEICGAEFSYHEELILAQVHNSGVAPIASELYTHEDELKFWDRVALFYEQKYLMPGKQPWDLMKPTEDMKKIILGLPELKAWSWQKSERQFLRRYYKLMDKDV